MRRRQGVQLFGLILGVFFLCANAVSVESHNLNADLSLSQEEIKFLQTHPVIRVQSEANWPPFNFIEYGQPKGFVNDYIRLLSEVSGLKFQFVAGYSWDEYVEMLKNHEIDLISNMTITPEREKAFLFSALGVVDVAVGLLTLKDDIQASDLDSISNSGRVLGVVKGFYHEELLKRHYPEMTMLLANDTLDLIKLVEHGKADAGLTSYAPLSYYLAREKNTSLKNKIILKHSLFFPSTEHIGIHIEDKPLKGILDKAMKLITADQLAVLKNSWPVAIEQTEINSDKYKSWSEAEKAYFANKKVINMCVDPAWMPFEGIENGKHVGMAADLMPLIQQQLGVPIQLVSTENWVQTIEFAKSRQCDILSMAMDTPERRSYLSFTDPYLITPLVIAASREDFYIADIASATNKRFGIVKGYAFSELLKKSYPQLTFVDVESVKAGLNQVEQGEIFGIIDSLNILGYEIQRNHPELKIVGKFEEQWYLGVAVRNDAPVLLNAMNNAIRAIPKQTLQDITNKWISVRYEKAANFSDVWKYIPFILLVLGIVVYRQYILKKYNKKLERLSYIDTLTRCANRQKIDEVLQYQVNDFMRHESPFSVLLCDIDNFKQVNDLHGHLVGDQVLRRFSTLLKNNIRANDLIGRWGGEEFLIVCPNTESEGAKQVALHLKRCLSAYLFEEVGHVTASFGVAEYNTQTMSIKDVLNHADKALYESKHAGRNRVSVYKA
ncbi:transporter substrate-binding domain-containing diguanylate cyclase [Alkalimarinus alittae]|uniref:diguanylate cyclase n=1 Tax=Alkalimarinus alittae TaxID=2961619 RepID=A0ABY6MYW9_9ALTE|nr:transporter substrate-binding domain-containing protein [Alkalimarinus alittae]UZE95024.1 transporter substrate-binding domain-containing protein [Alkalimarinus alittae]